MRSLAGSLLACLFVLLILDQKCLGKTMKSNRTSRHKKKAIKKETTAENTNNAFTDRIIPGNDQRPVLYSYVTDKYKSSPRRPHFFRDFIYRQPVHIFPRRHLRYFNPRLFQSSPFYRRLLFRQMIPRIHYTRPSYYFPEEAYRPMSIWPQYPREVVPPIAPYEGFPREFPVFPQEEFQGGREGSCWCVCVGGGGWGGGDL